jgi:tetratricopeptide (TPR) repeat protein
VGKLRRAHSSPAALNPRDFITNGNIIKGTIDVKVILLSYSLMAGWTLCLAWADNASAPEYQLAVQYVRQAEWKSAEIVLDRLLLRSPQHMPAVFLKARVLFSLGRYAESLQTAQRFLTHEPDNGNAHKLAGLAYFMTGKQERARNELEKAVELSPRDSESFYYLGRVYFTASNMPLAYSAFQQTIKLDPGSVRAHNHLGQTLEGLARFDEAKAAYLTAIKLEGSQKVRSEWPFHNLGALLLQQGEPEQAAAYFREALARNPGLVSSKVKLAMALSLSSQLEEARTVLEEALQVDPKSAEVHYQLARLLTRMGRPEEARKHFQTFQQLKAP